MIAILLIIFSIKIQVKDKESNIPIPYSHIIIKNKTFFTDSLGRIEIQLLPEKITVKKQGYKSFIIKNPSENTEIVVHLEPIEYELPEEKITGEPVQKYEITEKEMHSIPSIINDPLRVIDLLPSYTSYIDFYSTPVIRGEEEVMFYLDSAPFPYLFHFFDIFSIFNIEQIGKITVYPSFSPVFCPDGLAGTVIFDSKFPLGKKEIKVELNFLDSRFLIRDKINEVNFSIGGRKSFIHKLLENRKIENVIIYPSYEDLFLNSSYKFNDTEIKGTILYSDEISNIIIDTLIYPPYTNTVYTEENLYLYNFSLTDKKESGTFKLNYYGEEKFGRWNIINWAKRDLEWYRVDGYNFYYSSKLDFGANQIILNYKIGTFDTLLSDWSIERNKGFFFIPFIGKDFYFAPFLFFISVKYPYNSFNKKWKNLIHTKLSFEMPFKIKTEMGYGNGFLSLNPEIFNTQTFTYSKNYYFSISKIFKMLRFDSEIYYRIIPKIYKDLDFFYPDNRDSLHSREYYGIENILSLYSSLGNFFISSSINNAIAKGKDYTTRLLENSSLILNFIYISPEFKNFQFTLKSKYAYGKPYPILKGLIWNSKREEFDPYYEGTGLYPPYVRIDARASKIFKKFKISFDIVNIFDRRNTGDFIDDYHNNIRRYVFLLPRIISAGIEYSF